MRVLVLTCEEGEGHSSAARALEADLARHGAEVVVRDALKGGLGRVVPALSRDAYRVQLRALAWTYGLEYKLFTRVAPARAFARRGLAFLGSRPLLRLVRSVEPDLIVSTHPATTNVLGRLRRRGRIEVPVVATVTDFGVHPLWAHRGVDLHLVMHDVCVPFVERVAGDGSARVAAPIVARAFRHAPAREDARRALALPARGGVVLVSGGGWGVGDVEGAVRAALRVQDVTVVCLSGKNELLRARLERVFADEPRVRVVPFTRRMSELLAAADVLVDASVGVTCLEALASGCRIVVYGTPPGHSRDNERAIAALGLASDARTPDELTALLADGVGAPLPALPPALPAASLILDARVRPQPRPSRRRRIAIATSAAMLASLAFGGWTFASPTPYPLLARTFELDPLSGVPTQQRTVALVAAVPSANVVRLAHDLAPLAMHATFAVQHPLTHAQLCELHNLGDDVLPVLRPSRQPTDLIGESRSLRSSARQLGLTGRFYYLEPRKNFALADYLAARAAGGRPVAAARRIAPGAVVVVQLGQRPLAARAALLRAIARLEARGLRATSLSALLPSASTRSTGDERESLTTPHASAASATTSPTTRPGADGQASRASNGASATGTSVLRANTIGATWVTGRRRNADISLSVPTPEAVVIARNQRPRPSHALRA